MSPMKSQDELENVLQHSSLVAAAHASGDVEQIYIYLRRKVECGKEGHLVQKLSSR